MQSARRICAIARNRCAIARCAGSPTASGGNRRQDRQNTKSLRASSSVEAVRLVCEHGGHGQNGRQSRAQDAEGCICIVKNLNDGHRAIGKAEIILTSSLKQFRLDNIEVCCGLQKLVRAMMLQGCRDAPLIAAIARGTCWFEELTSGK